MSKRQTTKKKQYIVEYEEDRVKELESFRVSISVPEMKQIDRQCIRINRFQVFGNKLVNVSPEGKKYGWVPVVPGGKCKVWYTAWVSLCEEARDLQELEKIIAPKNLKVLGIYEQGVWCE